MAQLNSFELLNIKYSQLSQELRDAIERDVKFLLKENKGTELIFDEEVSVYSENDSLDSNCLKIVLNENTLDFEIDRTKGLGEPIIDGLEDLNIYSCYEILLALNEKSYTIK